jgi:hypothetical protein
MLLVVWNSLTVTDSNTLERTERKFAALATIAFSGVSL